MCNGNKLLLQCDCEGLVTLGFVAKTRGQKLDTIQKDENAYYDLQTTVEC